MNELINLFCLGLLAPINHFVRGKVSNISFLLVNLWLSANLISDLFFGSGDIGEALSAKASEVSLESTFSIIQVAAFSSTIVGMVGVRSAKWVFGAFLGGSAHAILIISTKSSTDWQGWQWILAPLLLWLFIQYYFHLRDTIRTRLKS